jgi:hypothetical protein
VSSTATQRATVMVWVTVMLSPVVMVRAKRMPVGPDSARRLPFRSRSGSRRAGRLMKFSSRSDPLRQIMLKSLANLADDVIEA